MTWMSLTRSTTWSIPRSFSICPTDCAASGAALASPGQIPSQGASYGNTTRARTERDRSGQVLRDRAEGSRGKQPRQPGGRAAQSRPRIRRRRRVHHTHRGMGRGWPRARIDHAAQQRSRRHGAPGAVLRAQPAGGVLLRGRRGGVSCNAIPEGRRRLAGPQERPPIRPTPILSKAMAPIPQQNIPEQDYTRGRSLIGLFSDLWRETQTLVHQEAELAKAEISEKVSQVTTGAGEIAAGGAILFAGFLVLLFAAVGALEMLLPTEHAMWLAPLIVGLIVMIVGYVVLARGRKQLTAESLAPQRTMESLQADARLAKEHVK